MLKYSFNGHLKFDVDQDLSYSAEYFERYEYLQGKCNQVLHLADKINGRPVKWEPGLKYDKRKHKLTSYFTKNIIELYPHNNEKTLAYCPDGVATIKLYLSEIYTWQFEIEKRLLAIISNIIFNKVRRPTSQLLKNRNRQEEILTKNEVYNILLILNSKLLNPLNELSLNKLTSYIWMKYLNGELSPPVDKKMSIRSDNFMKVFNKSYPDKHYTLTQAVRSEVNRVKGLYTKQKYGAIITNFRAQHPDCRYTDIIKMLCKEYGLGKSNAGKIYSEWKKVSLHTSLNNFNLDKEVSGDTFLPSSEKIEQFISNHNLSSKITQLTVSEGTGLSIATVKRYWPAVKELVGRLNKGRKKRRGLLSFPHCTDSCTH